MTDQKGNILDKIIKSEEEQKKTELNPQELVSFLLSDLNPREKEVISARYGLDREKGETLEAIGKRYSITRERVRQIENNALKKALATKDVEEKLKDLIALVTRYIHQGGYIRLEDHLLDELLASRQEAEIDRNCLKFVFNKFLNNHIEPIDIVHTDRAWKVRDRDISHFNKIVAKVKNIFSQKNKALKLSELKKEFAGQEHDEDMRKVLDELEDFEGALESYLHTSKHFKKNLFDQWGLMEWRTVNPKRMRDKIYLILLKDKEPLHYRKIAERINQEEFDSKRAHPATIHNELILDDRFVLIGRGIYALQDWGYKPGVISEVVRDVLKQAGAPLTREEITKEVLKQRKVKEGSINLTLSDKNNFVRLADGRYTLNQS